MTKRERKSKSCYLRIHHDECREHCGKCIAKFGDQARLVERNGIGRTTIRRIQKQDLYTGYMVWGRTKRSTDSTGFRGTNERACGARRAQPQAGLRAGEAVGAVRTPVSLPGCSRVLHGNARDRTRPRSIHRKLRGHVMNIDHIVLLVDNQQRSLAFFVDLLGMEPVRSDEFAEGKTNFPSVRLNEAPPAHSDRDLMSLSQSAVRNCCPERLGMGWPRSIHACSMGAPAPWREGAANFPITSRPRQHQMRGAIRPGSFQREGQGVGTDR